MTTIFGMLILLLLLGGLVFLICWSTIWAVPIFVILFTIYHAYKYNDACYGDGKMKEMTLLETIMRIVQQIIGVVLFIVMINEGDLESFLDLYEPPYLILAVIPLVLTIIDAVFYTKNDMFYKTETSTYTSDTIYDVSIDQRKRQVEVKPHTETTINFDESRIFTFVLGFIANSYFPIINIIIRKMH